MAREGQGYPCCQHDMMMMISNIIMGIIFLSKKKKKKKKKKKYQFFHKKIGSRSCIFGTSIFTFINQLAFSRKFKNFEIFLTIFDLPRKIGRIKTLDNFRNIFPPRK